MRKQNFSLVELLVVIGIIVLLAGLMIPAVMSSKTKGQITEAKADMAAIKMALKGVERDYRTIFKQSGSEFEFYVPDTDGTGGGKKKVKANVDGVTPSGKTQLVLGGADGKFSGEEVGNMVDGYYGMIAELSDPREVTAGNVNVNKRMIKYLDPRPDYSYGVRETMWQDPWGNPYVVMIDADYDGKVYIPFQDSKLQISKDDIKNKAGNSHLVLSGDVFLYSLGPNGEDDCSFNADNGGKSTTDDIRGWEK